MMTRNLSKSFKGKINGQRLPPIPVVNDQTAPMPLPSSSNHVDPPVSILKRSNGVPNDLLNRDQSQPFDDDDDDDPDSSRVIFRKTQADVLLLLDTYPPKTISGSKNLRAAHDLMINAGQLTHPIFDTLLPSEQHPTADLIETFPSPLSDRLPSSRYCRRSVSSACSRRSSIFFQRHPTTAVAIPLDTSLLHREDTFETLCESLAETLRSSYPPLPPIAVEPSDNLCKSLNIPSNDQPSSISPPLIVNEEPPALKERKEEFTRRLLSKSLHRETTTLTREKSMESPSVVPKNLVARPIVAPRLQKATIDPPRRVNSTERHPAPVTSRSKVMASINSTTTTATSHPRPTKFSLDIFQPQSKANPPCNATTKKTTTTSKAKQSTKVTAPKVKIHPPTTPADEEILAPSDHDVIVAPSPSSLETSQVSNTNTPVQSTFTSNNSPMITVEVKLDTSPEIKRHSSSCASSRYAHRAHAVPKPLTLQGEKVVDADYPQTARRVLPSTMISCQRRGSLKGQPLITELFEDAVVDAPKPVQKVEPTPVPKAAPVKLKKQRANFVKSAKQKKTTCTNKCKASNIKTGMKHATSDSDFVKEEKNENQTIIVGGSNWIMAVQPQPIKDAHSILSSLFEAETVEDEDLPSCTSPIDDLMASQATLMSSTGDLIRRNSIESVQAVEISPVLAQTIEPPVRLSPPPLPPAPSSFQSVKPAEPALLNTDIRTVYETVRDSMRKHTSLRSVPSQSLEKGAVPVKTSLPSSTSSSSSRQKTLPFEPSNSMSRTYYNTESDRTPGPALRVVNDSLNSRGSETIDSTSSHEDYGSTPLCTEADCDDIYRTARKGRQVGRGAYGTVFSYLTMTGRVIAVKEIELDENDTETVRDDYEAVREEVNILRALTHPYIVKFLGISLENTRLIKIFMEYLPNGTIENLLASFGPFHNDILKKYTRQIVEGVAYLHENNVVHRDIKGKNIMLDVDGNIKLIDFGCAKRLKKNQNTHSMRQILRSMKGTANWMAPEVIAETGHGKKADIWSIGCTLCEMATGKPPWSSEHNHLAVLLIIANGTKPPADLPESCPVSGREFFRLCLTRDPALRPSAVDLLMHPFLA